MTPLVLFDIDLTLIATNGTGRAAIKRAFMELLDVADPTAGIRFDGRTDRAIFAEVIASQRPGAEEDAETFARAKARYLALCFRVVLGRRAAGCCPAWKLSSTHLARRERPSASRPATSSAALAVRTMRKGDKVSSMR